MEGLDVLASRLVSINLKSLIKEKMMRILCTNVFRFAFAILFSMLFSSANAQSCKVLDDGISDFYSGGCKNGYADGRGTAKGINEYVGGFMNGNQHGKGTYTWADGKSYSGNWHNGVISGYGVQVFVGGDTYSGNWKDNKLNGYGVLRVRKSGNEKFIDSFESGKKMAKGYWDGDEYVLRGIYVNDAFTLACSSQSACEAIKIAKDKREQLEAREREREDAKRRAYENSPQGRSERQSQQLCEAQKSTCYASCPPPSPGATLNNSARDNCMFQCDRIKCN